MEKIFVSNNKKNDLVHKQKSKGGVSLKAKSTSQGKFSLAQKIQYYFTSPENRISNKQNTNSDQIEKGIIELRMGKYQEAVDIFSKLILEGVSKNSRSKLLKYIARAQLKSTNPIIIDPRVKRLLKQKSEQLNKKTDMMRKWKNKNHKKWQLYKEGIRRYRLEDYDKSKEIFDTLELNYDLPKWLMDSIKKMQNRIRLKEDYRPDIPDGHLLV